MQPLIIFLIIGLPAAPPPPPPPPSPFFHTFFSSSTSQPRLVYRDVYNYSVCRTETVLSKS
ncbi:hypothetical protein E2C01_097948 [Portunus trituberculatus]|uniref:Secreted protein n=1 Tax=Portunus trituberculatus TaxID=210409 RepID=A0A5B7K5Q0_PORTR|nr:hypothetical protein [Portunus trituberculatus]